MFVDDPAGSLRRAAQATESATTELIAAISNRRDELRQADRLPDTGDRTEQMRMTLRSYRSLCQSISQLGQSLADQPDQPAAERRPAPATRNPP
jgi:prophage DNA circulation protein